MGHRNISFPIGTNLREKANRDFSNRDFSNRDFVVIEILFWFLQHPLKVLKKFKQLFWPEYTLEIPGFFLTSQACHNSTNKQER